MSILKCSLVLTVALVLPPTAMAKSPYSNGTLREQAEQACYNDATTLCGDFVPDEAKITACMKKKRAQLSAGCRAVFDKGIKG